MKSILKTFAVVAAVLALAACNHKAEFTTDSFVRFDVTSLSFDEDAGSATIAVRVYPQDGAPSTNVYFECTPSTDGNRNSVQAEYGVDYSVSPADGVLSFYGDSTQYITIYPVQYEDFVTGDRCFTVTLTGADNGYRVAANYEVFVKIKDLESNENWVSLGECTYTDDFITGPFGVDPETYKVEIEEEENTPGWFRLVYPYDGKYPWNYSWEDHPDSYAEGEADWDYTQTYYLEIHAEDPEGVYIEYQNTGTDWGYGFIYVWSYADYYYVAGGYSREEIKEAGWCGTYKNGIITFPDYSLQTWMPDYSTDGFWYGNSNGAFKVVMPGTVQGDYTVGIDYAGKFTNADDENFAVAAVEFEGKDIAYARVAMAEGRDYETLIDSLKVGNVDCVEITESGNVAFPCEESGNYTIAVVSYSSDGEVGDTDYVTFKFTVGSGESWSLYGTGDYEYYLYLDGSAPDLELYQSGDDPTRFKIEHWGYDVDFYFTWDQETNEILVEEDTYTGIEHSSYGSVYVCDFIDDSGYDRYGCIPSYYKDGIFYFSVEYYCSAGTFCYGYETFTLDGSSFGLTTADLGSYDVFEISGFNGSAYYGEYALEASDDSSKGNVMFTVFDDFDCDVSPIYGDLDEDTGVLSFKYGQLFTNYEGYNFWFYTYYDYYAYFLLLNNGDFWGPFWGEMAGSAYGSNSPAYYWDLYMFMYGCKGESGPASIKAASASELHSSREHALDESRSLSVKPNDGRISFTKEKFQKESATSRYNFVPTTEVKARVIDKTQVSGNIQQASTTMK